MARPRTARLQVAYDQGRRGETPAPVVANDPELLAAYDEGLSDHEDAASRPSRAPARRRPSSPGQRRPARVRQLHPVPADPTSEITGTSPTTSRPAPKQRPEGGGGVDWHTPSFLSSDGSGFLLGLFVYALGLAYLRYGAAGVKGWLAAKFLNNPPATLVSTTPPSNGLVGGILGGLGKAGITPNTLGNTPIPQQPPTSLNATVGPGRVA